MRYKKPFLFFYVLFSFFSVSAQYNNNVLLEKAERLIYETRFDSARQILYRKDLPKGCEARTVYLKNTLDIIQLLVTQDYSRYKKMEDICGTRVGYIKGFDHHSPWYLHYQGEMRLQWAFIRFLFGRDIDAVFDLLVSYRQLEHNARLFPDFKPAFKYLGVLHVITGTLPEGFRWGASLIGFSSSVQKGLLDLKKASESDGYNGTEAVLLRNLITFYMLSPDLRDIRSFETLLKSNQGNLLILYCYSQALMRSGRQEEVITMLQQTLASLPDSSQVLPLIHYQLGNAAFLKGDFVQAPTYFQYFLSHFKGVHYRKDALYKLSVCAYLQDQEEEALLFKKKIAGQGTDLFDADKFAGKYGRRSTMPDKNLLRARILTDGGNFKAALEILNRFSESSFVSLSDKTEWYYRKGRAYDLTGNKEGAVNCYEKTIQLQGESPWYFAPNSCLHLGYLSEAGDSAKAVSYFKKAIRYKNYEYKNSIDNKAKAELNVLKTRGKFPPAPSR